MTGHLSRAPRLAGNGTLTLELLGCCSAGFVSGCSRKAETRVPQESVYGLSVAQVTQQTVSQSTEAVGTIHAAESATLSAQVTGRITSVVAREGDAVSAGQTLITLDDAQSRAETRRAQANVDGSHHAVELAQSDADLAASTLARYRILRDRKSVSAQEFDEVERRSQAAQARLEAAKPQLSASEASQAISREVAAYTRIAAPFNGRVTTRLVDPGTLASPGVPLLVLDKAGPLELHVTADESLLSAIHLKARVAVRLGSDAAAPVDGIVTAILPAADPASHTFVVKITLIDTKNLHAGMYVSTAIDNGTRKRPTTSAQLCCGSRKGRASRHRRS